LLGLILTVSLAILTPPFQVPDEQYHFYRAYELSEGQLRGERHGDIAGAWLPASLPNLVERFVGQRSAEAPPRVQPYPFHETRLSLDQQLAPDTREFVPFPSQAFYSPLGYLPQATAMALGRAAGCGPLALLYVARIANAMAAVTVLSWAVALLPVGTEMAILFGLLPMALVEYASVSADASVIAGGFLLGAIGVRAQLTGTFSSRDLLISVLTGIVVCSTKPVYVPILLMGFSVARQRQAMAWRLLFRLVIMLLLIIVFTLAWVRSVSWLMIPWPQASPGEQAHSIFSHPLQFSMVLLRTVWWKKVFFYHSLVGILGWLSVLLPGFVYALPIIGTAFCVLGAAARTRLDLVSSAWNLAVIAGGVTLVMTAMYIDWTPLGDSAVNGVQGRYFLPFLSVLGATVTSLAFRAPRILQGLALPLVAAISAVDGIAAIATILRDFEVLDVF
jgi:uncharacterized membrane protein